MGIPLKIEPEPQGVDKYLSMATKIANYIEEHPKVVEYGVPALTFVAGLFTGKKWSRPMITCMGSVRYRLNRRKK